MKSVSLTFLLVVIGTVAAAQVIISLNSGIGTYKMSDLKAYQLDLRKNYPVNVQVTSSFPAFWTYDLSADFLFDDDVSFGLNLSRGSTGGRIDFTDYSGSMGNDQLLSYFALGGSLGTVAPLSSKRVKVQLLLKPMFTMTNLHLRDYLLVANREQVTINHFRSSSFHLQPTVDVAARFGHIGFNVFAGYNIALTVDPLKSVNGQHTKLVSNNKDVRADWSGARVGGGVSFFLKDNLHRERMGYGNWSFGFGLGVDYGGLGANIVAYPSNYIGTFIGLGVIPTGLGVNGGVKFGRPNTSHKVSPYLLVMYGYNAVIKVINASNLNRVFYGPTIGFGLDIKGNVLHPNHWSLGVGVPIRDGEVDGYITNLKNVYGVVMKRELLPITLSLGYRITPKQ